MSYKEIAVHYFRGDVITLVATSPYLQLLRQSSWHRVVSKAVTLGRIYARALADYPTTRCEPLDFHYLCLQSLAPFDEYLLQDMLTGATFRGVPWACTLVALEPKPEFGSILEQARPIVDSRQHWAVDLALSRIHGSNLPELAAEIDLAAEMSSQIAKLSRPQVSLRLTPSPDEELECKTQVDELRRRLKSEGVASAKAYYSGSKLEYYGLSLREWNVARSVVEVG